MCSQTGLSQGFGKKSSYANEYSSEKALGTTGWRRELPLSLGSHGDIRGGNIEVGLKTWAGGMEGKGAGRTGRVLGQ